MSELLVIVGMLTCALSGVPGLFWSRHCNVGQLVTTGVVLLGCVSGLSGVGAYWADEVSTPISLPWSVPGGRFLVAMDGLSAFFLVPIYLITALGSIYGLSYWKQTEHSSNARKLRLFYGLLAAGMALLVIAKNGMLFLVGWEVMALSAYFLVTTEDHDREVQEAGLVYLIATHFSTLCLFGLFALLAAVSGSFELRPLSADEVSPDTMTGLMVLSAIAFGLKAGVMPLHVWLPGAHSMAPSHVSAIMSGVIIKMGIYGFLRITGLLPAAPLHWSSIVLVLGVLSGVLGVAYAIGQHDLKRLLAYHSIENIGIIVMGIGLALAGRSLGRWDWVVLGLAGALLHVWNHAFFKALLFLCAGAVVHATHTREIDRLGGLARVMPRTALCFQVGAVAICGLPPLNGFVSELLVYLGLFRTLDPVEGTTFVAAAFAVPALALIGTLAVACFVKVYGAVFLGKPRSELAAHAHEASTPMLAPMAVLVGCCLLIGIAPLLVAPVLTGVVNAWAPEIAASDHTLTSLAPLDWIGVLAVSLLGGIAVVGALLWCLLYRGRVDAAPTWGCGYAAPTPRMQYTASSFAQMLVGLFAWALRPNRHAPTDATLFPQSATFHSDVPDAVLDRGILPTFRVGARLFTWFRVFQHSGIQTRILYLVLTLIILLLLR